MMWVVGKEGKPKSLVLFMPSAKRSKWYRLTCFCKSRRKDGTCQLTDGIRPLILASARKRVRLEHPSIDKRLDRLPDPDSRAYQLTPEVAAKVAAA